MNVIYLQHICWRIYIYVLNHKVRCINTSQWPQFTCIQWNALVNSGWINICAYRLNTWVTCVSTEFQYTSSTAWQIDSSYAFGCIYVRIPHVFGDEHLLPPFFDAHQRYRDLTRLRLLSGSFWQKRAKGIWPITISRRNTHAPCMLRACRAEKLWMEIPPLEIHKAWSSVCLRRGQDGDLHESLQPTLTAHM